MTRIDTVEWKKFPLRDLFDFKLPQGDLQVKQVEDGEVPLITPSAFNNGLLKRISAESQSTLFPANTLTVDMFGNAYYQEEDYYVTAHGHVNVLLPKIALNKYNGMFVATAIRTMFLNKYGFSEMCTQKVLKEETVVFPVTDGGDPNWEYMDSYMQDVMKESEGNVEGLRRVNTAPHPMAIHGWQNFKIGDLFEVVKGTRLTKADQVDGEINFISASSFNNGIAATISNDEHIHPGNTMTVSYNGSDIGRTFYQEDPFWASDDVNVLYPKFPLTKNIALFIAPIIKAVGGSHVYKNKWLQEDMKVADIMLPVTDSNVPDWDYMEDYMSNLMHKVSESVNSFSVVVT